MKIRNRIWVIFALAAAIAVGGCPVEKKSQAVPGYRVDVSGEAGGDADTPVVPVFEYVVLDATPLPPNPITDAQTPAELNRIAFTRVRADTGSAPPRPVSSIVVLGGGHTLGGSEMRYLGEILVRLSKGDVEVWLQERRFHFLEDNTGTEAGEQAGDPNLAWEYYFAGREIDGKTWDGPISGTGPDSDMLSEWGLDMEMADLRTILSLIPEDVRADVAFLGGHSRGVAFAQAYASYVFKDGRQGSDDLAGLVLIDGGAQDDGAKTEDQYFSALYQIRNGNLPRIATMAPFGPYYYITIELLAMAAKQDFAEPLGAEFGPDGIWRHRELVDPLYRLLFRGRRIEMSNAAVIGTMVDTESGVIPLLSGSFGRLAGGAVEDVGGRLIPVDEGAYYYWDVSDEDVSDLDGFLRNLYEGPSNGMDRYYTTRIDLDLETAWHDQYDTVGDWRQKYFDMRSREMDAPVYALASGLMNDRNLYVGYRDALARVRGSNLPRTEEGFEMVFYPDWGHMDAVAARPEHSPFYADLLDWVEANSYQTVQIPRM